MNKLLVLLFLICTALASYAQEDGIAFEKDLTWSKVVKKAKKQKKLIFIDCYTSWCGPCKKLAKNVFTQKIVGDYFNKNFINTKYDCDQPQGIELKTKFNVQAYPTLIFYNPTTDQIEHQCVGAGNAEWLIENGKKAFDKENNLAGLTKRFETGTLSTAELQNYLKILETAYMKDQQKEIANKYIQSLTAEQLCEKDNWNLFSNNIKDIQSDAVKMILQNMPLFYEKVGKEVVESKLESCLSSSIAPLSAWEPLRGKYNEELYNQLIAYLPTLSLKGIPQALNQLYITNALAKEDYNKMFIELENTLRYNFYGPRNSKLIVIGQIGKLGQVKNKELTKKALEKIDSLIAITTSLGDKAKMYDTKAYIQYTTGDASGAEQSRKQAKSYKDRIQQNKGTKTTKAIKMN